MSSYVVEIKDKQDNFRKRVFNTYRDALCCATNYNKVKEAKVIKDKEIVGVFSF